MTDKQLQGILDGIEAIKVEPISPEQFAQARAKIERENAAVIERAKIVNDIFAGWYPTPPGKEV